jgi:hypothetical protein
MKPRLLSLGEILLLAVAWKPRSRLSDVVACCVTRFATDDGHDVRWIESVVGSGDVTCRYRPNRGLTEPLSNCDIPKHVLANWRGRRQASATELFIKIYPRREGYISRLGIKVGL